MRTAWQFWVGGRAAAPAALVSSLLGVCACARSLPASDPPARLPPTTDAAMGSVSYRVPGGCPNEARFRDEVDQRAPAREARTTPASATRAVRVEVTENAPSDWIGRVSFERDGTEITREVTGAQCEEVVVALALIASLWLSPAPPEDGELPHAAASEAGGSVPLPAHARAPAARPRDAASEAGAGEALPAHARAPAAHPRDAASEAGGGEALPAPPPAPTSASPAADELSSTEGEPERVDTPSTHRVQLAGIVGYASDPGHAIKGRLQAELWGSDHPSSWAVALGVAYAQGRHRLERLGTAALDLIHGQLELCLPGTEVVTGWWLRGCGHGRAGGLHFSPPSESLQSTRSLWRPWLGVGPSIHSGLVVSRTITLRAGAELSFNLVRDQFATERASSGAGATRVDVARFYEANRLSLELGLGAAYAF